MADYLPYERKPKDFCGFLRAQEAEFSAINPGIMAEYFLETLKNTGNFNIFAASCAQTYVRNYGGVL